MLTCKDLTLNRGDFSLRASWKLGPGITAVIGPSGGGKSTLLAAIAGFLSPIRGDLLWKGTRLTQTPPGQRPVAMLFQDHNLFPHLTITQNVGLGLSPSLRLGQADRQKISAALAETGLAGLENRKPAALSGGQQSRAALARALIGGDPIVLLDEPFSALGPGLRRDMLALTRKTFLPHGATVLMVTHDPEEALPIADTAILVADGIAHAPTPMQELWDNPPEALRSYLGHGTAAP